MNVHALADFDPDEPRDERGRWASAEAMGFDTKTTFYHGSGAAFEAFDPLYRDIWVTADPQLAGEYAKIAWSPAGKKRLRQQIYPVLVRTDKLAGPAVWRRATNGRNDEEAVKEIERQGYEGVWDNEEHTIARVFRPENVRSKFARFDPSKVGSANLSDASPDQDDIREGLDRELTRRWTRTAREIRRSIITHDALGIGDKAPQVAQPTGDKAEMFRRWLNERLAVGIGGYDGSWLEPFVRRASDRGASAAMMDAFDPDEPRDEQGRWVFWHGSPSGDLRGSAYGLHVGTHEAAKVALEARIGVPADGQGWNGDRAYGDTLLAGGKTLKRLDPRGFNRTGFNADVPQEDFYARDLADEKRAKYSGGSQVPMDARPEVAPYVITGEMTNAPSSPMADFRANAQMSGQIKKGSAKRGYYYRQVGEDEGSISAVVPSSAHLKRLGDAVQAQLGFMVPGAAPSAKACHGATVAHLAGICEDVSQRAHDSVADGLLARRRPSQIARLVDHAMGHGLKRSRALAEHAVTQAFSQATLDGLEARGVTHVGTVSERRRLRDAFDPDEPRDDQGRWTSGGSGDEPQISAKEKSALEEQYAYGDCDILSLALHEATGLPLRAVVTDEGKYAHTWVQTKDGHALDIWGKRPEKEIEQAWIIDDDPTAKIMSVAPEWVIKNLPKRQRADLENRKAQALKDFKKVRSAGLKDQARLLIDIERDDVFIPAGTICLIDREYPASENLGRVFDLIAGKIIFWANDFEVETLGRALEDAPRKNPQPKHPRSGRFAKAHVVAREMRRSKRTGQFRKQGVSAEEQRKEELAEARFGRVRGKLDILTAGDDRVCDVCDDISANGPYTINAARGLIPAHPNCRCVFVAAGSMKDALLDYDPSEPRDPLGMWTKTDAIVAYHGSGHDFSQFAMEHVGEGEGSQVYGHGLYLAEEPHVAESYKEAGGVGRGSLKYPDGRVVHEKEMSGEEAVAWYMVEQSSTKSVQGGIDLTKKLLAEHADQRKAESRQRSLDILQTWKAQGAEPVLPTGNLYQVKIHATPDEFLDWDKPLSQQSKLVQDYVIHRDLGAAFKKRAESATPPMQWNPSGEQMMRGFIGMGPKGAASLREAGIKGVRYLDQASRQRISYDEKIAAAQAKIDDLTNDLAGPTNFSTYLLQQRRDYEGDLAKLRKERDALPRTHNYVIVEPAIIEITHHNGKPLTKAEARDAMILLWDFDPDEPRDEQGRWTSFGSVTPSLVHAGGEEFVSPSVETGLTFNGAKAALASPRQTAMLKVSDEIDGALGLKETAKSVIGAWADGAENSVLANLPQASWDEIKLSAAMKGYVGDQKAVLAFKQDDNGDAFMYEMHAKGALDDIHHRLLNDGLAFHTLAPTADGADVYVADLEGKATEAIQRAAKDFNANATYQRGRAEFIGTQLEEGTDRAIRDDARRNYEGVIQQSPVSGGAEVWRRNRDRWSQALTGVRAKKLIEEPPRAPGYEEVAAKHGAWATEVANRALQQAHADGYPARHIEVLGEVNANVLAGANYNTLAQYSPHTGRIQVFSDALPRNAEPGSANTVEGTVAHEIMHAKTDLWLKMHPAIEEKLKDKIRLGSKLMDEPLDAGQATPRELMRSDGVTPYSRDVWDRWTISHAKGSRPLPFDLPFGETIAEMRAIERETGEVPGAPEWKKIYANIEAEWQRAHAKNLNERLRA